MQKQREIILKAQAILAAHLPPDGKSAHEAICELLELLDGPESREALAPATQESAPAELPSFVAGQTYESSEYGPLVFERLDTYYGETTYQFFWPAERRKRWIKPDDMRRHFCAAASPQPVAKVLNDMEILALRDHAWEDVKGDGEYDSADIKFARAVLAASTPTTLTEKKE